MLAPSNGFSRPELHVWTNHLWLSEAIFPIHQSEEQFTCNIWRAQACESTNSESAFASICYRGIAQIISDNFSILTFTMSIQSLNFNVIVTDRSEFSNPMNSSKKYDWTNFYIKFVVKNFL